MCGVRPFLNGSRAGPVSLILLFFFPSYYYLLTTLYYFLPFRTGFGPSLFLANIPLASFECSCTSSSLFLFLSYSTILWSIALSSAYRDDHVLESKAKRLCCFLVFSNFIANILNATSSSSRICVGICYSRVFEFWGSSSLRVTLVRFYICCRQLVPTKLEPFPFGENWLARFPRDHRFVSASR